MIDTSHVREVELIGLNGANPLGFLAALGTFYLLSIKQAARSTLGPVLMSWSSSTAVPKLHFDRFVERTELAEYLATLVRKDFADNQRPPFLYNDIIAIDAHKFRAILATAIANEPGSNLDLLAGFGSDANIQTSGKKAGCIEPSEISFANGQSMRYLLNAYANLVMGLTTKGSTYPAVDAAKIEAALFDRWTYTDEHKELRWDPSELRLGATPSQANGTVHGANVLAFWALAVLRSVPTPSGLRTAGVHTARDGHQRRTLFVMPRWLRPLSLEVARSLIESELIKRQVLAPVDLKGLGITGVSACEIITEMKANYFAPSFEL